MITIDANRVFDSDDLAATEDFLNAAYTKVRIGSLCGDRPSRTRIVRRTLGSLAVDEAHVDFDLDFDADPLGRILLCRTHQGRIHQRSGRGADQVLDAGQVAVTAPDRALSGHIAFAHCDAILLPPDLLKSVAVGATEQPSVRLTGSRPVSAAAGRFMLGVVDYIRDLVYSEVAATPLIASTASQYLAASLLTAFPNSTSEDGGTAVVDHSGSPALLRRAIAFIEDNAEEDIAIGDIAASVYVTPRAVQYMFRRHRDCTPMEYLRRIRLERAHRELLAGDRTSTSVSEVANRWGFAHTGRFAVSYRQVYGRSPHETLRA